MFPGIGSEFVEYQRKMQRQLRGKENGRPRGADAVVVGDAEHHLVVHERMQLGAFPMPVR